MFSNFQRIGFQVAILASMLMIPLIVHLKLEYSDREYFEISLIAIGIILSVVKFHSNMLLLFAQ